MDDAKTVSPNVATKPAAKHPTKVAVMPSGHAFRVPRSGATVHVSGGAVSKILVNGKPIGRHQGVVQVPPHGTIKLVYTRQPRWTVEYK
jgi:hypothetical protein